MYSVNPACTDNTLRIAFARLTTLQNDLSEIAQRISFSRRFSVTLTVWCSELSQQIPVALIKSFTIKVAGFTVCAHASKRLRVIRPAVLNSSEKVS